MDNQTINIRDYTHNDINFIITSQLKLYKDEYGFDSDIWKNYLIGGVHQLVDSFDPARDCLYILEVNGNPAGSIAITHIEDKVAQLRFYFVQEEARGTGAGQKLIDMALEFCQQKSYQRVFLWTFSTLYTARHLYAKKGFVLAETQENKDWGTPIIEERWDIVFMDANK